MTLLVLSVVLYLAITVKAQNCTALANDSNCDFYTQCVEPKFRCGTSGYPLAYGDRYCRRLTNSQSCFTSAGQSWIDNVNSCLMKAILNSNVYNSNGACGQLHTFAFNSHQSCYTDNGFCTDILLNDTNLHCLAFEVFDLSDYWNKQAIEQVLQTATTCSWQVIDSFLSSVDSWISNDTQIVTCELLQSLKLLIGEPQINLSTYSNEFFVGFYKNIYGSNQRTLYVYTMKTSPVTFNVTSLDGNFSYMGNTSYHNPHEVDIPQNYEVLDHTYSYRTNGLKVYSLDTEPISVIAWSFHIQANFMSYLALPCHKQPTTQYAYYVVSTFGYLDQTSQFMIIGCLDNSNVTIIPNNDITVPSDPQDSAAVNIIVSAGHSFNFVLHSFQTFFVSKPHVDLTGTKIISDSPLTIISGHEAAQVPAGTSHHDPIVTQLTPTITWGKTFLLPPHMCESNGKSYKVIATNNETNALKTCGTKYSAEHIKFDENDTYWFYISNNVYCSIISDQPIYIAQIGVSTRCTCAGGNLGDHSLNTVPPIEQYEHSIQFSALLSDGTSYYSVVVPNDVYFNKSLLINSNLIYPQWVLIYASNGSVYGYGYSTSFSGTNTIAHPEPNGKIFVSIYGWRTYTGYSYVGGMKLNPINIPRRNGSCLAPSVNYSGCCEWFLSQTCSNNGCQCHQNCHISNNCCNDIADVGCYPASSSSPTVSSTPIDVLDTESKSPYPLTSSGHLPPSFSSSSSGSIVTPTPTVTQGSCLALNLIYSGCCAYSLSPSCSNNGCYCDEICHSNNDCCNDIADIGCFPASSSPTVSSTTTDAHDTESKNPYPLTSSAHLPPIVSSSSSGSIVTPTPAVTQGSCLALNLSYSGCCAYSLSPSCSNNGCYCDQICHSNKDCCNDIADIGCLPASSSSPMV